MTSEQQKAAPRSDLLDIAIKDVKELAVGLDTPAEQTFALVRAWFRGYQTKEEEGGSRECP
jgi:hypothetical protein